MNAESVKSYSPLRKCWLKRLVLIQSGKIFDQKL